MLVAGSTIDGRYRLISLIGEGGMASVWRAEDDNLKRAVAIKLLYLGPQRDPRVAVEQFLREARIAAAIQHRNVIHTVDFGTTEEQIPYMVMELLHGESLAARMERAPALRVEEWVRIAEMTLRGLAAVHDAGIVHRDLKPQNIFLQRDADAIYPKILDFGISRSLEARELASPIATQQGFVIGTPHYMAPEQARGEAEIDRRADIYSLGTILYEALAGRLPFDADNTGDLLVKILSTEPVPLRQLCPAGTELIADCVMQAMAREPAERFADARAFRTALQRAFEQSYPEAVARNRSELPLDIVRQASAAAPARQASVPAPLRKAVPQNDGTRPAWGDFEGLAGRASAASAHYATVKAEAAPNVAAVVATRDSPVNAPPRQSRGQAPMVATAVGPQTSANDGEEPMFGESPLDGFAGSAAVALELDYAPRQDQRRSTVNEAAQEKPAHEPAASAVAGRRSRPEPQPRQRVWWLVPAVLALLLAVFLLAPGMFSMAPPDQAAARKREEQSTVTRGSSRVLRRQRPEVSASALPQDRELLE